MKNIVYNLTELPQIVSQILATPQLKKVLIFKAEMGAGKTTLIKEIVKQLGVSENTASPTFGYVNEYKTESNETVYHFDLYRLEDEETAYQLGNTSNDRTATDGIDRTEPLRQRLPQLKLKHLTGWVARQGLDDMKP